MDALATTCPLTPAAAYLEACLLRGVRRHHRGPDTRPLLTAFGPVPLSRRHFHGPACHDSGSPVDGLLGLDGSLRPRVPRLACRLSGDGSFDVAPERLFELCGLRVDGETLRRHGTAEGAAMAAWARTVGAAATPFQAARGDAAVRVDAGEVNTTDGWRDLKVVVFAKRPRGEPALPETWDRRHLPGPSARLVLAETSARSAATGDTGPTAWAWAVERT